MLSIHCTMYDMVSLTSLKNHTNVPFITWFCRKLNCLLGFQIQNHIQIIEGSDNGISDNWDLTVLAKEKYNRMA